MAEKMAKNKPKIIDTQGWDSYWDTHKNKKKKLYDFIAEFYRKRIIRPLLNHFISRHFPPNSNLLHAGCGSGQVDRDIRNNMVITGLDFSENALLFYSNENASLCKTMYGSILDIPVQRGTFDGIYNLGVMEHFTEDEIMTILAEFRRVLKPGGKVAIFWPPEFGLSVIFFKILRIFLTPFYGKNVKLHPDEITRIQSRQHANRIFEKAQYEVIEYYFGIRDLFTYSVIVAKPLS